MPVLQKVDEFSFRKPGATRSNRSVIQAEYDNYLNEYGVGEFAVVSLAEGENRTTVRNRLQSAAKRKGVHLKFRRSPLDRLRFEVLAGPEKDDEDYEEDTEDDLEDDTEQEPEFRHNGVEELAFA